MKNEKWNFEVHFFFFPLIDFLLQNYSSRLGSDSGLLSANFAKCTILESIIFIVLDCSLFHSTKLANLKDL